MKHEPMVSPAETARRRGTVTVDVISDVVCPWCYVGKRRLEAAVAKAELPVELHWRPFQLDPTIPSTGLDRNAYLTGKFGSLDKVAAIHERLAETGRAVNIPFRFDAITRAPNTLDAHRLIRWASSGGRQDAVVEALFRAYFIEGRDIGDSKDLVRIAGSCGMDEITVHRLLASGADSADVQEEVATAGRLGVTGVPFFIFAGRYAVPGAQDADVLAAAIVKAKEAPTLDA
jgi:predicted DsbA family dithiol-disulfide isomerase